MYLGDEEKKNMKMCLGANKQGFASLYALMLLHVMLAFVLLMLSSSKTILANKQLNNDLHLQQLYAIYHVKVCVKQPVEENTEIKQQEIKEETLTYRNQSIYITYYATHVDITIAHVQMRLELHEMTKDIMNLVYL